MGREAGSVARRSARPPWNSCSDPRHGIAQRASCKQHLNKANNYKYVLPSQLAGLAGVPLKCSTRLCSPLHIGQLCIAKTLRLLLDFSSDWFEPRWQPTVPVSETLSHALSGNATLQEEVDRRRECYGHCCDYRKRL